MNRNDLQNLSNMRRREAAALLKAKQYHGAYYLAGYAVECALKACIAKQTSKFDFPNKDLAIKSHVHKLEQLLKVAGLETEFENDRNKHRNLDINWAVVKDWTEASRYTSSLTRADAKDFYSACISRSHGVLTWIKTKW